MAGDALHKAMVHEVEHDVQARGARNDHVRGVDAEQVGSQRAGGGQTVGEAVVGGRAARSFQVGAGIDEVEHRAREVRLLGRGLAARHVQREVLVPDLFHLPLEVCNLEVELRRVHLLIYVCHVAPFGVPSNRL